MDVLEAHKDALEEGLYFRLADLLNLDVEVMYYDTTSLHFEIAEEDGDGPGGGASGPRKRGRTGAYGRSQNPASTLPTG